MGIEGTNDPKGPGKELWRIRGFSVEKGEEKNVQTHQGSTKRGAPAPEGLEGGACSAPFKCFNQMGLARRAPNALELVFFSHFS